MSLEPARSVTSPGAIVVVVPSPQLIVPERFAGGVTPPG